MTKDKAGNEIEVPYVTAQQILARIRERKAKSTLLMAILDEHLSRFHGIKDAKTSWAAIKTRFGGNAECKKMQRNILKQQFEIFSVSNSERLDKGYDRFQRLLSLLEIYGAGVSTKDTNQKFLRSLPLAWSNISLIMRNKPGIDNLDIDDMYNNLKVYKADIKGSSGSSLNSHNVAFVSIENTSSTNELNAAYSVSTAIGYSSQAQGSSSYANELMFSYFANQSSSLQLDNEDLEQIDQNDLKEMDLKWQWDCKIAKNPGNRGRDAGNAGRLGHVNLKTMNKLVKGNLVRGLPSKIFENDHSCVACQKGK
nr:ribonuclease H-like domain-containing protein [Tanacetum cinerariifolium]